LAARPLSITSDQVMIAATVPAWPSVGPIDDTTAATSPVTANWKPKTTCRS
jgi:hypothetical protein